MCISGVGAYVSPHEPGRQSGQALVNGCKVTAGYGLLRNSTKIAAQFLGLGQCSQKAPGNDRKL